MKFMFVLLGILWLSYELQLGCCLNCNGDQYTVVDSNDVDKECLNCGECHPAYGKYPRCGTRVTEPVESHCKPCPTGTFSDKDDTAPCKQCHHCVLHEKFTSPCTNVSDTVCNGTCDHGYFFTKKAPHNCQECSYCCNDGKDTIQQECVKQGLNASNQHCSVRLDKYCGPTVTTVTTDALQPTGGGGSSKTVVIVLGLIGALSVVVVTIIIAYFYVQRRKKQGRAVRDNANSAQMHVNMDGRGPDTSLNLSQGASPSTENTSVRPKNPQLNAVENPNYKPGTPQLSERPADSVDKSNIELPNVTSNGNYKLARQTSKDSQESTGENGEQAPRKRRSSSIVSFVEGATRKMSIKRDGSLLEDDMEEDPVPVIEVYPQSPREEDQVELTCKVNGQNKKVSYQWLKDDEDLTSRKCSPSLVLDSVKLRDFGSYTCCLRYDNKVAVKTSPVELDVLPHQGMRYKLLKELDLNTEEKICDLLGNKAYGCGRCQHVADKYGMDNDKRRSLEQSQHPAKDVLDFLGATHPDLTVYKFCKTLKGENIQRLDVVSKLLNHLAVKDESA